MGKLLTILLIMSIVSLPLGEVARFDVLPNVSVRPLDVFIIIAAVFCVVALLLKKIPLPRREIVIAGGLFASIGLIALLFNAPNLSLSEFIVSYAYLFRWICYGLLFIIVLTRTPQTKKTVVVLLQAVGILLLFAGYTQYFFYPNLRNLYYLGWDDHLYRLFSTFLDPNFAGAFFVLYAIFVYGSMSGEWQQKRLWMSVCYGILEVITIIAVVLTYSRSALIMLFVSMVTLLVLYGKKKWIAGIVVLFLLLLIGLSPTFSTEGTNLLRTASGEARLQSASDAWQIIQKNPLIGVGFDAYRYAQIRYHFRPEITKYPNHAEAGTDNSFLFVFATTGIIGLISFLYLQGTLLQQLFMLRKKEPEHIFPLIGIVSLVGLYVDSQFNNSLFFVPIMCWVWIILGLMDYK